MREVRRPRFPVVLSDKPVHRYSDIGGNVLMTSVRPCVPIRTAILRPVLRRSAQNTEEHRDSEFRSPQHRLGAATGAEPDPQRLLGSWDDEYIFKGTAPVRTAPRDALVGI